ncbi:hypothetical protein L7F22_032622 [Adiantum nelumboides]|nr:hypothetical protein [Adiantum nelumboides]
MRLEQATSEAIPEVEISQFSSVAVDEFIFMHALEKATKLRMDECLTLLKLVDVVILNKIDVLRSEVGFSSNLNTLESEIHHINSLAKIVQSEYCSVDLDDVLHCRAYDTKFASRKMLSDLVNTKTLSLCHDLEIATVCVTETRSVCLNKVRRWLEQLLWEQQDVKILRAKGILNISASEFSHMLQAVQDVYEITPVYTWEEHDVRSNKIVFIGKNLNEENLARGLRLCSTEEQAAVRPAELSTSMLDYTEEA